MFVFASEFCLDVNNIVAMEYISRIRFTMSISETTRTYFVFFSSNIGMLAAHYSRQSEMKMQQVRTKLIVRYLSDCCLFEMCQQHAEFQISKSECEAINSKLDV